jgi:hypothetical protein
MDWVSEGTGYQNVQNISILENVAKKLRSGDNEKMKKEEANYTCVTRNLNKYFFFSLITLITFVTIFRFYSQISN